VTGYNVQAGSGGVLVGTAAVSTTDIANYTSATIGNSDTIHVTGDLPAGQGNFVVSASNNVDATDSVRLDSGGLIDGAGATDSIKADTNDATASVGDNDNITTVGDLDLETVTSGTLSVAPQVHTYGLAAAASVDALARIQADDEVDVGNNTTLVALGNLNLYAGQLADGQENNFSVTSFGDELNGSAVRSMNSTRTGRSTRPPTSTSATTAPWKARRTRTWSRSFTAHRSLPPTARERTGCRRYRAPSTARPATAYRPPCKGRHRHQ